jgi:GT2 family glycosyltransferase
MTNITSIMFVTYNRLNFTKRMLDSFFKNTTSPYHLIIVDNGSTDGTQEYFSDVRNMARNTPHCQGLELQLNKKNMGIAAGRNQGLRLAAQFGDEYLSTLDNDIELPPHWLKECIDIIQVNPKFAIGLNMEGTPYPLVSLNGKTFQLKSMGNLGTACTVFNKSLHQTIGYFTTDYGLYGEEDADFFFRARMLDYQMGYLAQMGLHFGEGSEDIGPYREFKTKCHADNLAKFQRNCALYMSLRKSYFIPFCE